MSTRPKSRVASSVLRNSTTPASTRSGATATTSKDRAWTTMVVPTLAPSMTESAGASSTSPPAEKAVSIRPVAVELCKATVTVAPAPNALTRLESAAARKPRSLGPNVRWTPVCTMCTPHNRSAAKPARSRRVR